MIFVNRRVLRKRPVTADHFFEQWVVQRARQKTERVPIDAVRKGALAAGALGCTISGAGPTMFAWALENDAQNVRSAMVSAFGAANMKVDHWVVPIKTSGAYVLPG